LQDKKERGLGFKNHFLIWKSIGSKKPLAKPHGSRNLARSDLEEVPKKENNN
jgi:hypothetical protein